MIKKLYTTSPTAANGTLDKCTLQSGCLSNHEANDLNVGHLSTGNNAPELRLNTAIGCSARAAEVEQDGLGISPGSRAADDEEDCLL